MRATFPAILILGCLLGPPVFAEPAGTAPVEDQVSFQVGVEREVDNDRAVVTLSASAEDRDPSALAQRINQTMNWALGQLKGQAVVKAQSGSYRTYPVYDKRRIVNWRGAQTLVLKSSDTDRLARMVGRLQDRLQVQDMRFLVSPERRRDAEAALTAEALAAFQKRADLIRSSLGASAYRLMDVNVRTGGAAPRPMLRADTLSAEHARVSAPSFEQGTSRISVQVSGRIHLVRDPAH